MKLSSIIFSFFLIACGFSLLMNAFFGFNIPVLPITIGFLLILWGCKIAIGSHNNLDENASWFSSTYVETRNLRGTHAYNFYFSDVTLKIPHTVPTKVIVKSVASSVVIPGHQNEHGGQFVFNVRDGQTPELTLVIYSFCSSLSITE